MSDLRELYQEVIIDHGRHPRNAGVLPDANHVEEGFNPLCGDRLTLYIMEENNVIKDIKFEGSGCAISMASASLMTEALKGKTLDEVKNIFTDFHDLVTGVNPEGVEETLGKLAVLGGVAEYPMRVKCATLCWHTALSALQTEKLVG